MNNMRRIKRSLKRIVDSQFIYNTQKEVFMIVLKTKNFDFDIRCSDCGTYSKEQFNITNGENISIYLCSHCFNNMINNLGVRKEE